MMRVILEPLIGDVPIVGAVTMFFIQRPVGSSIYVHHYLSFSHCLSTPIPVTIMCLGCCLVFVHAIDISSGLIDLLHSVHSSVLSSQKLDINWTGLTNLLDIPGLK